MEEPNQMLGKAIGVVTYSGTKSEQIAFEIDFQVQEIEREAKERGLELLEIVGREGKGYKTIHPLQVGMAIKKIEESGEAISFIVHHVSRLTRPQETALNQTPAQRLVQISEKILAVGGQVITCQGLSIQEEIARLETKK